MNKKLDFSYEPGDPGEGYVTLDSSTPSSSRVKIAADGVDGLEQFKGELIVDLNAEGKIVGIEILGNVIPDRLK